MQKRRRTETIDEIDLRDVDHIPVLLNNVTTAHVNSESGYEGEIIQFQFVYTNGKWENHSIKRSCNKQDTSME